MTHRAIITEQHIKDAEEAMRLGLTYELGASYIGVGRTTFYRWLSRGEREPGSIFCRFWDAVKRGEAKGAALSLARIQRAAKGSTDRAAAWQADAWLLERRHGYRRDAPPVVEQAPEQGKSSRVSRLRERARQVGLASTPDDEE
jgi:hypothetical protein